MKEIHTEFEHIPMEEAKDLILLDTCFMIYEIKHQKHLLELLEDKQFGITSFNAEELIYVGHRIDPIVKRTVRKLIKKGKGIKIVDIPVHPGNRKLEREFVRTIDPELLDKVEDASDAVLIATAIKTHSDVVTKDKHHMFNTILDNFLRKYEIRVYKDLNFLKD